MNKRFPLEYFTGLVCSLGGFVLFFFGFWLIDAAIDLVGIDINLGGDKGNVFFGLFFGLPMGNLLGINLADRVFFDDRGGNILGLILGLVSGFVAGIIGVFLLDRIGEKAILMIPFLVTLACLLGYRIPVLFRN